MKTFKSVRLAFAALALGVSGAAFSADIDMSADANDLAIQGYDPVAYFTDNAPVEGSGKFTATYKNAIYQFSNAKNRDLFKANPTDYAPQFGGFCAMGVALGKKFEVDPTAWRLVDGKLYLNLNKDIQAKWSSDIPGNLAEAGNLWPHIKGKLPAEL